MNFKAPGDRGQAEPDDRNVRTDLGTDANNCKVKETREMLLGLFS